MRPGEKRASILRYDLKTGVQAEPLGFAVQKLGNLLAVDGRLVVANEDEVMCFTTPKRELAEIDERARQGGPTGALLLERALVLRRAKSSHEETLAAFTRALDTARETGERATPIRIRALDYLFETAAARKDLKSLDVARTILKAAAAEKGPFKRLEAYEAQTEFLAARLMAELGRPREAFDAIETFLDDYASQRVVAGDEVLDGSAAARQLRSSLIAKDRAFLTVFVDAVRARIKTAEEAGDAPALLTIPPRYDYAHPTQESLFALSRLYEAKKESVEAEGALREVLERYSDNASVTEAHLRLARLLVAKGMPVAARIERNKAVGRLDEASRARLAALLAEVDRQLPAAGQAAIIPDVKTPLKSAPLKAGVAGAPVRVDGNVRTWNGETLLLADERAYYAFDKAGTLLWRQANPAGAGISFGPGNHPDTSQVAALVAARRTATAAGGRLVIGDVFGITCLDARTGKVHWQRPRIQADAARAADSALRTLRADLAALRTKDDLLRGQRLPTYATSASAVVGVHPLRGVEAFEIATGELLWQDTEIRSPTLGHPHLLGQLLAVGWAHPGRVRVYGMVDGRIYHEHEAPQHNGQPGALLAPPLLDPLGRLLVIFGRADPANPEGALEIRDARNGQRAFAKSHPANSRHAAVLYADGHALVFHDGGSGGLNLHFIDLATQRTVSRTGADMLREVDIAQDGSQLYVFTHTPGLADLGGRLFRVDVEGKDTLAYEPIDKAGVFSRPLLTRNHIAIADRSAERARLRLFDREASRDTRTPRPVFVTQVGLVEVFEVTAATGSFNVPPSVEGAGGGLVFTNPYRNLRFSGPEGR
jgi:tetratricopeptide (TPR) repeat protein